MMSTQTETQRSQRNAAFLLAAVAVIFWAAYSLRNEEKPLLPLIAAAFVCSGVLFALGSPRPTPWHDLPEKEVMSKWRKWTVIVSLVMSVVSFVIFWFRRETLDQYSGFPLVLWLASIFVFWLGVGGFGQSDSEGGKTLDRVDAILPVLLFAGAFLLRVYQIDVFPNGCQTDECNNGLDALQWLQGRPYAPFLDTNEGQATLFTYLLALSFKFFGVDVIQMRIVSALVGSFTIVVFYFFARDWLERRFAFVSAALFAVSRWHLTFSRIVYELILTPLAEILVFFFFLRALKNGRRRDWALSGLCLAFGMNTYTAFRVIPILVVIYLVYWVLTHRQRLRRDVEGISYLFFGAWIGVTPLTVHILQNWGAFMERTTHISIFNDIEGAGGSLQPLWSNIKSTLWSFHFQGDMAALNNLPGEPLLDIVMGVLVLLGLAYAIRHIREPLGFLCVTWVVGGLSLAILSTVAEAPTARRPIGLLPVIYLMSGLALQLTADTFRNLTLPVRLRSLVSWGGSLLLALTFLASGAANINTFFNVQAKNAEVWNAYSPAEAAIGKYIYALPPNTQIYMESFFDPHSAIVFISKFRTYTALNLARHMPLFDAPEPVVPVIYIMTSTSGELESAMKRIYPDGVWRLHEDQFGEDLFYTFELIPDDVTGVNKVTAEYYDGDRLLENSSTNDGLQFLWSQADAVPLPSPFSARWSGSIYFPSGQGVYEFSLSADGVAELSVDGKPLLKTSGEGRQTVSSSQFFVGGFHAFTLTYHGSSAPREISLLWKTPTSDLAPIPRSAFFGADLARNGLTGYYYPNADLTQTPSLIQHDLFVMPNNILPEPYGIVWKGKLRIPKTGEYVLGTYSDDGSYVYVDGQLVVDNGGEHGGIDAEGMATFEEGLRDLEIHYWQIQGGSSIQFWWQPPGEFRSNVPLEYLFPEDQPEAVNP